MTRSRFGMALSCTLILGCGAGGNQADPEVDPCQQAWDHLASCFPDQDVRVECDPETAEQIANTPCEKLGSVGKADGDWVCFWMPWLCTPDDTTDLTLASDQLHPEPIALTNSHVYWINRGVYISAGNRTADLKRVPKDGGPEELITHPAKNASLAASDSVAYWTETTKLSTGYTTTIRSIEDGDSSPSDLLQIDGRAFHLLVHDDYLYWTRSRNYEPVSGPAIERLNLVYATAPEVVASDLAAGRMRAHGDHLYFMGIDALQGTGTQPRGLHRVRLDGTSDAPEMVSETETTLGLYLTEGGDALYWKSSLDWGEPVVYRLDLTNLAPPVSTPSIVFTAPDNDWVLRDLAADETHVYVTAPVRGRIYRVPASGASADWFVSLELDPTCLALDATDVYWTNDGSETWGGVGPGEYREDGEVRRLSK